MMAGNLTDKAPRLSDAELDAMASGGGEGQFSKGIRSGALGMGGQLNTLAGEVATRVGAPDFAQGRFAAANDLNQQAAEAAPRVTSIRDVHGGGDAWDYGAGLLGGAVPMVGTALAATALTRGRGGAAVGAGAMMPFSTGDVLQRQKAEGQPTNLRDAAIYGGVDAVANGLLPGMAAGKMLKGGAAGMGGHLMSVPEQAALSAGGEYAKQVGGGQKLNTGALVDAAAGGAAMGLPVAAMGAAGAARGRPGEAKGTPKAPEAPLEAPKAPTEAPSAAEKALSGLSDTLKQAKDGARAQVDRVRQGLPADFGGLAELDPTTPAGRAELAKQFGATAETVKGWADGLLKRNLTPEQHEAVTKAMGDLSDAANQAAVAGVKAASDAKTAAVGAVDRLREHMAKRAGDRVADSGTKQSRDYGGIDEVVRDRIMPALKEVNPEVANDPAAMGHLASALRSYMERPNNPSEADLHHLHDVLGHKASDILMEVRDAMGAHVGSGEDFFAGLNKVSDATRRDKALLDEMRNSLKREHQDNFTMPQLRKMAADLTEWARQPNDRTQKGMYFDERVNQALAEHFDKPDKIRKLLEREAEPTKLQADKRTGAKDQDEHAPAADVDYGTPETGAKVERIEGKTAGKLLDSPEVHRAKYGSESEAERLIKDARQADPNSESSNYRWMHAAEYHALTETHPPKGFDAKANQGYVVRESMEGSDKLTASNFSRFAFDKKKGAHEAFTDKTGRHEADPSVVKVHTADKDVYLDARKLARAGEGASDGATQLERMAKTFADRVAAATEYLGTKIDVPDSTVVGKRANGDIITAGDLKKAKPAERADVDGRMAEEPTERLSRLKGLLKKTELDMLDGAAADRARLMPEWAKLRNQIDGLESTNRVEDHLAAGGVTDKSSDLMNVHHADATRSLEPHKFNMDGTPVSHTAVNSSHELAERGKALGRTPSTVGTEADIAVQSRAKAKADEAARPAIVARRKAKNALDTALAHEDYAALDLSTKAKVDKFLGDAHERYTELSIKDQMTPAEAKAFAALDKMFGDDATTDLASFYPNFGPNGSTPNPKALAAKQAAFLEKARSGDQGLIDHITKATDAASLQRAATHLAGAKMTPEVQRVTDAINARMGELVRDDPQAAYNLTKRSAQAAPAGHAQTAADQANVTDYVDKAFAGTVKTEFAKIAHAGEFERMKAGDVIRVSVHALDPLGTAYHESLHGFFAKLDDTGNASVKAVLMRAADGAFVKKQLSEFLKNSPDALKQLADPEERAAYMFQAWALGKLKVGPETHGVLNKIAAFFRNVLGMWSNDERALHIMEHFQSGEYAKIMGDHDAVRQAYMEPGRNKALEVAKSMTEPLTRLAETVGVAGGARLRDTGIPALRELADLMKVTGRDATGDAGFIPAARTERTTVMNRIGDALGKYSKDEINDALENMQKGTKSTDVKARTVQAIVAKQLSDMKDYMRKAGVDVTDLGPDYFPRVYNADYISRHQKEFITLLEKHGTANAAGVLHKLVAADGNEFRIETARPGMQNLKLRSLKNIPDAELAPYMSKDLYGTLNSYITQATRRAEWARRFDDNGGKIDTLLSRAKDQGADAKTIAYAKDYVMGVDGTLGDNLNPTARRLMGDMIVYQNVRLLPLAIFSSVVDPAGVMVRGGTVGDAWGTFKRGVKEITKNFQKEPGKDSMTELAETMGVVDNAALVHSLGALYSQGMVGETGRKINDTFFKYNLMEQFNTSMRVGAMEAAIGFIGRHADGSADKHSGRWIAELGLQKGDIQPDAHGRPKLTEQDGLTPEQASRMRSAVNRWVDGAVLRPDAADKPVWMNDPHFALISHLKQFVYSFHETIIKRVLHETEHGNYRPAMAMASYVPIMIASDMVKGLIQGGGQQPEWKENWGVGDYLWSGVQRAGMLGTGQFVADAGMHAGSLAGPTLEQLGDAALTVGGREQFSHFAVKSMPANALYASAFKVPATDPAFAD